MYNPFRIPKQSDRSLISAMERVRSGLDKLGEESFVIVFQIPYGKEVTLPQGKSYESADADFIFDAESQLLKTLHFRTASGTVIFTINRQAEQITDQVTFDGNWPSSTARTYPNEFAQFYAKLVALARSELKAVEAEAALSGGDDNSWERYRNLQTAVLSSLQQTSETIIQRAAEQTQLAEKTRSEKFSALEEQLHLKISKEIETQQQELDQKAAAIAAREAELTERQAAFNTKESRYVARQKQEEQITQVKGWLEKWTLTEGTTQKRRPIFWGYIAGIFFTAFLTLWAVYQNYAILKTADDVAKLLWWQWLAILSKALFPLAGFTTFLIYFIRWTSAWARQHAEEEFRNRALVIDIGRSGWLLEAVRDSLEAKNPLPAELLKELSRNLFAYSASPDGDILPNTFSDMVFQGLSSLRIKSPDGTEVEANRGAKAKEKEKEKP